MAKGSLQARRESNLDRLLAGEVGIEEAALEYSWQGPNGLKLRHSYVLQQFAQQVCDGDYERAAEIMDWSLPALGNSSAREAAKSDTGMLGIRAAVAEMVSRKGRQGAGAYSYFFQDKKQQDCTLVLDLLPIAWGLTDDEFCLVLGRPISALDQWRRESTIADAALLRRVARLKSFHNALRTAAEPREYPTAWRTVWSVDSLLGSRSLLQAVQADGDIILDRFENFLWLCSLSN
jgi:hypothetical protein